MNATTASPPRPPAGFTKVGTGWFEPAHVPVAMSTGRPRRLIAHDEHLGWAAVAPIVAADARTFTVACPLCPAPKLRGRRRKAFHELTATHVHGRSNEGDVQHRAAHHGPGLPGYLILDVHGVLARTAGAPR